MSYTTIHSLKLIKDRGFTLIEITLVIVILGIVTAIGSQFVLNAMDGFRTSEIKNKLVQRGRLSIEQITRELHMALPNAIRISASGDCIEFLPIVASANYHAALPAQTNTLATVSQISTSSFVLGRGMPRHVVVAPFSAAEVYVSSSPAAIVGIGTLVSSPYTAIPLANSHRFIRNSVNYRVFIVDNPVRYCISGQNLVRYSNYGFLTTALTDSDPGGSADIVSHDVSASSGNNSFVLSAGSEDMNTTMRVNLAFSKANISIDLNHQVLIRNVP